MLDYLISALVSIPLGIIADHLIKLLKKKYPSFRRKIANKTFRKDRTQFFYITRLNQYQMVEDYLSHLRFIAIYVNLSFASVYLLLALVSASSFIVVFIKYGFPPLEFSWYFAVIFLAGIIFGTWFGSYLNKPLRYYIRARRIYYRVRIREARREIAAKRMSQAGEGNNPQPQSL